MSDRSIRRAIGVTPRPLVAEPLEARTLLAAEPTSSMAYDAAGTLHLAYYDASAKNLKYTTQSPAGVWSNAVVVDASSPDVGQTPSLAVNSQGRPGVAYFDAANDDLRYATLDGDAWTSVAVESEGSVGQRPSLAYDSGDAARISYHRQGRGDLRLATLKNPLAQRWTITTIARQQQAGLFSSVAINPANDKPVVAYTDARGRVFYARGGDAPTLVAKVPGEAREVGLAFSSDGTPFVAYQNVSDATIEVAESTGKRAGRSFSSQSFASIYWYSGTAANPTLIIDDATGQPQVVYYDGAAKGVFLATRQSAGGEIETKELRTGGNGFVAARQPGNNSISFALVASPAAAPELGNTASTPLPPTGIQAKAIHAGEVRLVWLDNADNETGFLVERSTGSGAWTTLAQLPPDASSYSDVSTVEATTYRYRVSATGGAGQTSVGTSAPVVYAGPNAQNTNKSVSVRTPPATPTGLSATILSDNEVALNWVDNSAVELRTYVMMSMTDTNYEDVASVGPNVTAYTLSRYLEEETTYHVSLFTEAQDRSPLAEALIITTLPKSPADLTLQTIAPGQMSLSWTNRSATASYVTIERSTDGENWEVRATLPSTESTYQPTGLVEGEAYYFRVKAVGAQSSLYSNTASGMA